MNTTSASQGQKFNEQNKNNKKVILITDEDCDQLVHELHLKDNGYSWIILGALFAQCVIVSGFFTSFGIVINAFTDEFPDVTFTMIGVLMGLLSGFRSLLVPLVGQLEMNIGSRNVMIIGALLFSFSLFASILCNKFVQIAIILGVLLVISQCLIESCQIIVLSQYFDSNLALANGIRLIGSPFGGIIYPAILTTLFQNSGTSFGFIWLTGISLHLYICAFIIRPIEVQTQIRVLKTIKELFPKLTDEENDSASSQNKSLNAPEEDKTNINKAIKENVTESIGNLKTPFKDRVKIIICFIRKFSKNTEHENKATENDSLIDQSNKNGATYHDGSSTFRSFVKPTNQNKADFRVTIPLCQDRSKPISRKRSEKRLTRKELYLTLLIKSRILLRAERTVYSNLRFLINNGKFYLFLFLAAGVPFVIPFVWYFTALYAKSIGLSPFKISSLFIFQAFLELFLRMILEWLNNKNLYNKSSGFLICLMISGFGTILMPFGKSLTYLMSMTGFYTFGCASFHSCANDFLAETFNRENETTTWSIFRLIQGFFSFIHPVYIGYMVDQTGGFKVSFIVMGTIILLSGLSFFVENVLHIFIKK